MADEHQRFVPPGNRAERVGLLRVAEDAELGVAAFDHLAHAMGMEVLQPHRRPRMLGGEPLHERAHVMQADRVDRGHDQAAGLGVVQRADFFFQLLVPLHDLPAAVVEALALGGQIEGSLRAIEELDLQPLFNRLDDLAAVRLRNVVVVGGAREAPPVDHVAEDFEGSDVHGGGT